jgi:hypothetical protein
MTQLKLFTLVGVANLLLEVSPELLYGAGPNCGVCLVGVPFPCCSLEGVSESVIIGPLLEEPMLTSGSAVTRYEV